MTLIQMSWMLSWHLVVLQTVRQTLVPMHSKLIVCTLKLSP